MRLKLDVAHDSEWRKSALLFPFRVVFIFKMGRTLRLPVYQNWPPVVNFQMVQNFKYSQILKNRWGISLTWRVGTLSNDGASLGRCAIRIQATLYSLSLCLIIVVINIPAGL